MTDNYSEEQWQIYATRFDFLLSNLVHLANDYPRATVLYPMMDKPIYHDFETLVAVTLDDTGKSPTLQ